MMKLINTLLALATITLLCAAQCKPNSSKDPNSPEAAILNKALPEAAKPAKAVLADVNCWTENEVFYAVGLVDSQEPIWQQFWLVLSVVDDQGRTVKFQGDTACIVATHADVVPPRGRTAFMASFKLSELSGKPANIALKGAKSIEKPAGAILLASYPASVKVLEGKDSTAVEKHWMVNGAVENPLPQTAEYPCIDLLIYGTDNKLYFVQPLDLNRDTSIIRAERSGAMGANEKRQYGLNIFYQNLPQTLQNVKMGRIDALAFEKR